MVLLDHFANKSNTFQHTSLPLSLSHFLPFPPWDSTSSNPGIQDCAIMLPWPTLDQPSSYLKQGSLIWPPAGSKPKRERPAAILASLTPFDLWPTSLLNSFNLHHQLCFCILVISSKWQFQSLQMIKLVLLPGWQNLAAFCQEQKWQWKFSSSTYSQILRQMPRFCA